MAVGTARSQEPARSLGAALSAGSALRARPTAAAFAAAFGPSRRSAQQRGKGAFGKLGQLGDRLAGLRGGAMARPPPGMHRRALLSRASLASGPALLAAAAAGPPAVSAAEPEAPVVLTDEEMAARVRRKQELLRERQLGLIKGTDLPPDFNPEAGTNLRAKTIGQNLKESLEKQNELKQRKASLRRDDMCEMLGRGC